MRSRLLEEVDSCPLTDLFKLSARLSRALEFLCCSGLLSFTGLATLSLLILDKLPERLMGDSAVLLPWLPGITSASALSGESMEDCRTGFNASRD